MYIRLCERDLAPVEVFRLLVKSSSAYNSKYLFEWLQRAMQNQSASTPQLLNEICQNIDALIRYDKATLREILVNVSTISENMILALE